LQETFIKAYYNLRGYDANRPFSSWIYRIAHNQTISTYRKKSVRPEGHVIDVEDSVIDQLAAEGDIGASVDRALLAEMIGKVLPQLDIKYREIIVLRYFQGYSYQEIAEILQKPEGSIATLLHRAKKSLRTLLEASEKI
jgi:RNA polymerase sigma-70 factor (ECF subfamily)